MNECTHTLAERWDDCSDGGCPFCLAAECHRLRALNAEMREKATALCDELQEQGHGGSPPHNWECAICFTLDNLRAILAKSQEAAS